MSWAASFALSGRLLSRWPSCLPLGLPSRCLFLSFFALSCCSVRTLDTGGGGWNLKKLNNGGYPTTCDWLITCRRIMTCHCLCIIFFLLSASATSVRRLQSTATGQVTTRRKTQRATRGTMRKKTLGQRERSCPGHAKEGTGTTRRKTPGQREERREGRSIRFVLISITSA